MPTVSDHQSEDCLPEWTPNSLGVFLEKCAPFSPLTINRLPTLSLIRSSSFCRTGLPVGVGGQLLLCRPVNIREPPAPSKTEVMMAPQHCEIPSFPIKAGVVRLGDQPAQVHVKSVLEPANASNVAGVQLNLEQNYSMLVEAGLSHSWRRV